MTGIASTAANLALWRMQWETLFSLPHILDESEMEDEAGCRLSEIENFGDNPGNLRLFQYVPANLPPHAPLVVVLHGCTQTAAGYDRGSGWSRLAEEHGFAVLFAQQRGENNPRRCFNWFRPVDIVRDSGEAASIHQMVDFLVERHDLDRARIFVTGLSAGGAMTNVMLASYPDVFAAGAIIAGLPYRSAKTVHEALQVMLEGADRPAAAWGDEVRAASPLGNLAAGRIAVAWPRVAVWQGLADDTVRASNAREIVKQWTDVHGLDEQSIEEDDLDGHKRMRWRDGSGRVQVEAIAIEHLGHAVPVAPGSALSHEQVAPYFVDTGLSSTLEIARFFGLITAEPEPRAGTKAPAAEQERYGVGALSQALAALPPALRGRRPRLRGREVPARPRPQPAVQTPAGEPVSDTPSAPSSSVSSSSLPAALVPHDETGPPEPVASPLPAPLPPVPRGTGQEALREKPQDTRQDAAQDSPRDTRQDAPQDKPGGGGADTPAPAQPPAATDNGRPAATGPVGMAQPGIVTRLLAELTRLIGRSSGK